MNVPCLSTGWICPSWSTLTAPAKLSLRLLWKHHLHGRGIMVMRQELKGRAVLYSEGGDTATLSWKREASHLPAEGEDSDTLTSAKCLARVAGLTCHQPLALGLLLFLWPKVCRIGLAAPTDHISAAEWPEFSSSLLKLTSWLLMRPINGQLELSPDKCPKAHCLAGCGGVTRTYQLSD